MSLTRGRQLELGLLLALCLFLPLYEAPKSLAWLAYVGVWLANRVVARDFGGRWDFWDSLIAAWIGSAFLAAAFAGLRGSEWHGALDVLRYGSVLWTLRRSRFSQREIEWVLGMLVASVVAGLALGYARMAAGTAARLELNSVGHVNHTAIYLAMALGLCVSWLFIGSLGAGAAALVILVSLFVTQSRAGLGAGLLTMLVLGVAWWRRSRRPLALAVAVLLATALVGMFGATGIFEKQMAQLEAGDVLNYRDRVWHIAITTWERHPWFGVGMDNFALVTRGEEEPYRSLFPHAHNLFLNTLAERGAVGAAALAAVLLALLVALVRRRPSASDGDDEWLPWGAAAGAWIVTCVAGLVNTTLHHEHGLLACLLFGCWLARLPRR